nr:MAG TPA: hypothetical protein [Caudoviricetes sp.]
MQQHIERKHPCRSDSSGRRQYHGRTWYRQTTTTRIER